MIKDRLGRLFFVIIMTSSAAIADPMIYQNRSLIGIEGGVTSINYDVSNRRNSVRKTMGNVGFKLGAQSHDYRIFLMANYYTNPDSSYDYIGTYGGQFDYLLNVSTDMNIYIGVNAGIANMEFTAPHEVTKRTISDPYYGFDGGLTFHESDFIDLEFGARMMMLDAENTKNGITYTFNNFITGYASIIFKYQMD